MSYFEIWRKYILERSIPDTATKCWNWQRSLVNGYGYCRPINSAITRAHRLAYVAFNEVPLTTGLFICHTCDNRKCVNPGHLVEKSVLWNNRDKVQKRRQKTVGGMHINVGSAHGNAKLTEVDIILIRKLAATTTQVQLAKQFGITQSAVSRICNRQKWSHI